MTSQRKLILAAGAVGAYVLLKPKTTAAGKPAPSLLSSLLNPNAAKPPTTTNLATGYGTRTTAGLPSTIQSLTPAQIAALSPAQRAALGLAPAPTLAQQLATGGIAGLLNGLVSAFKGTPGTAAPAQQPQRQSNSSGQGSSGGSSSGGSSGGAQRPGVAPSQSYDPYSDPANYDAYGNYVGAGAWDANGNYIGPGDQTTAGMFDPNAPSPYDFSGPIDEQANYQPGGDLFQGPVDLSSYQPGGVDFQGPVAPIDENGNPDPGAEYGMQPDWGTGSDEFVGPVQPIDDTNAQPTFDPGVTDGGWWDPNQYGGDYGDSLGGAGGDFGTDNSEYF